MEFFVTKSFPLQTINGMPFNTKYDQSHLLWMEWAADMDRPQIVQIETGVMCATSRKLWLLNKFMKNRSSVHTKRPQGKIYTNFNKKAKNSSCFRPLKYSVLVPLKCWREIWKLISVFTVHITVLCNTYCLFHTSPQVNCSNRAAI